MDVGTLVTLVAVVHSFYLRDFWVQIDNSPIVYRYNDWTFPVPARKSFLSSNDAGRDVSLPVGVHGGRYALEDVHESRRLGDVGVAAVQYFFRRDFWVPIGNSPIVYRYIDWTITVPLQMVEFYLILSAVQPYLGVGLSLHRWIFSPTRRCLMPLDADSASLIRA